MNLQAGSVSREHLYVCDRDGVCVLGSPAASAQDTKLDDPSGEAWQAIGLPRCLGERLQQYGRRTINTGRPARFLVRGEDGNANGYGYACQVLPLMLGRERGMAVRLRPLDQTPQASSSDELERAIIDSPAVATTVVRLPDWVCRRASRGFENLLGMEPGQCDGASLLELFERAGDPTRIIEELSTRERLWNMDTTMISPDGRRVPALVSGHRVDCAGSPCLLLSFTGVAEQRRLTELAGYDALTGLPNRHHLADRLHGALAAGSRRNEIVAVLFIDLDGFKQINDQHGHRAGDEVLATAARRINGAVRGYDTVARLGGDEFVVVLERLDDPDQAQYIAEHIHRVLSEPVQLGDARIIPEACIGVALYPFDDETIDGLLHQADCAMYRAKAKGGAAIDIAGAEIPVTVTSGLIR